MEESLEQQKQVIREQPVPEIPYVQSAQDPRHITQDQLGKAITHAMMIQSAQGRVARKALEKLTFPAEQTIERIATELNLPEELLRTALEIYAPTAETTARFIARYGMNPSNQGFRRIIGDYCSLMQSEMEAYFPKRIIRSSLSFDENLFKEKFYLKAEGMFGRLRKRKLATLSFGRDFDYSPRIDVYNPIFLSITQNTLPKLMTIVSDIMGAKGRSDYSWKGEYSFNPSSPSSSIFSQAHQLSSAMPSDSH